ncbi:hypothetical protein [Marinibactrum halimedae]|uniref:Uncharacterized protein n=1 Tax=Marinibactrum halimedae TaxID=1444977 RepID=A0AA37WKA1_9GAMM|nr:hypothetical protein [Marinibactrum halimedae]MCD9460673.1 hypothetical protein [Marinibactrum halimedae]GLS24319.1 hypothetical protein GCM10007877_00300 [Marinibactrum halimedae]
MSDVQSQRKDGLSVVYHNNNVSIILSFLFLLFLTCLFLSATAQAAGIHLEKHMTEKIKQLSKSSSDVVVAQVGKSQSRWVGPLIVTSTELMPIEILKGRLLNKPLKVTTLGGTVGNIQLTASHQPMLHEGELAMFFLQSSTGKSKLRVRGEKVILGEQGKINIKAPGYDRNLLQHDHSFQGMLKTLNRYIR